MSHAKATKPEVDESCPHTHKNLVVESLTVRQPGGKGSVSIMATESVAGIWVATGAGVEQIGLVAQKGLPPYLVIWDGKETGLPSVAITADHVQLPDASNHHQAVIIPFADLLAALRQLRIAPPPA